MVKSLIKNSSLIFTFFILILGFYFVIFPSNVSAQQCGGSVSCCPNGSIGDTGQCLSAQVSGTCQAKDAGLTCGSSCPAGHSPTANTCAWSGGNTCTGPSGGPCTGSCPSGQTCRAATAGNGGACGCHAGGGGNCNHTYSCAAQGNSVSMGNCCSGANCCGIINSGPRKGQNKICRDNGCAPNPPACTVPVISAVTRINSNSLKVDWTPGAATTSQTVYVGANKAEVNANCPGNVGSPACVVKATGLAAGATTYTTANILSLGTVYYVKVFSAGSCNQSSGILNHLSSCLVSPTSAQIKTSATQVLTTSVNSSSEISFVTYSSNKPLVVSVSPASDTTYAYQTTATGNSQGSAIVTSTVYLNGVAACTGTTGITVVPSDPWWQVQDSDISSAGSIVSAIPTSGVRFNLDGPGGFPGVVVYSGAFDFDAGTGTGVISSRNWLSNTSVASTKIYDSTYFARQIPSDVEFTNIGTNSPDGTFFETGGTLSHGFYWYRYDGSATGFDFTINSSMNLGDRRVILLVDDADLYINGNINLNNGSGFFMTIAGKNGDGGKGNIFVSPIVGGGVAATPNLEGIYLADGVFKTGTNETSNDIKIYFRGSITGYDGVNLERDLGAATNGTTPAEFFEYAPDQIMLFPKEFGIRKINWKEVAP